MIASQLNARRDRVPGAGGRSAILPIVAGNVAIVAVLSAAALATSGAADPGRPAAAAADTARFAIPESMRSEHEEIHGALIRATQVAGPVGVAARELAAVLHPHFVREEQIALPPLALLEPLSRGQLTPAMRDVLPMTDSLRAELPRMLAEHAAIRVATLRLGTVARSEGNTEIGQLADDLAMHARSEEEILYPAAVLVGDIVRARSRR
jgi:hypothetical protein